MTSTIIKNQVKAGVLVQEPALSVVALSVAKESIVVEGGEDDALIQMFIDAATDFAELYTGRRFITQTWSYSTDELPARSDVWIEIPAAQVQSVESILYVDADGVNQTANLTDFYIDTASHALRIMPVGGWPTIRETGFNNFTVRVVEGYGDGVGDIPAAIVSGVCLIVGHLYRNRETTAASSFKEIPFGATAFLDRHRVLYRNDFALMSAN